jgi:hypothetical protein
VQLLFNLKSFKTFLKHQTCFGQYGHHQVLKFVVIGETAALVIAVVLYFPPDTHVCCTFKEGHAAKSAAESKHNNHNMRAHLGKIYNNSNN